MVGTVCTAAEQAEQGDCCSACCAGCCFGHMVAKGTARQAQLMQAAYDSLFAEGGAGRELVAGWLQPPADARAMTTLDFARIRALLASGERGSHAEAGATLREWAASFLRHAASLAPKLPASLRAAQQVRLAGTAQQRADAVQRLVLHRTQVLAVLTAYHAASLLVDTVRVSTRAGTAAAPFLGDELRPLAEAHMWADEVRQLLREQAVAATGGEAEAEAVQRAKVMVTSTADSAGALQRAVAAVRQLRLCLVKQAIVLARTVVLWPNAKEIARHVMRRDGSPAADAAHHLAEDVLADRAFAALPCLSGLLQDYRDTLQTYGVDVPRNLDAALARLACGVVKRRRKQPAPAAARATEVLSCTRT